MSRCHACGQERGESLAAHLASLGWDGIEHCLFKAIYEETVTPCKTQNAPGIRRCCQLCGVSKEFGTWKQGRTGPVFEAKEAK